MQPLCDFIEQRIFPVFDNRDYIQAIENIEQVLAGLATGTLDRQEAVTWGEAVYQRWRVSLPGIIEFKTGIKCFG